MKFPTDGKMKNIKKKKHQPATLLILSNPTIHGPIFPLVPPGFPAQGPPTIEAAH